MDNKDVPYIVHESALMRAEKTIKRLTIIAVLAIVLMFITNAIWIYEWTQYDTVTYEQDGKGINNVNLGTQGDVLNGTESQNQSQEETEKQRRKGQTKMKDIGLSRSEISYLIDEWIFSERDRKILKRRLLDGICFEPLAEEFDLSVRQIKNIVYKGENKIFNHVKPQLSMA